MGPRVKILAVGIVISVAVVTAYFVIALAIATVDGAYRAVALTMTSRSVTTTDHTDQEVAEDLMALVVSATPIPVDGVDGDRVLPSVIDDHAWGTLIRGRAFCDSQAMALVQLLETHGLRGQLLLLRNDDGDSPHSVATVWLDGAWRVLDPLYGAIPTDDEGWLSVDSIRERASRDRSVGYITSSPRIDQGYAQTFVPATWFLDATAFYQTNSDAKPVHRRAVEAGLRTTAPLFWPGVRAFRDWWADGSIWLPNDPQPGDAAYERARTALLTGDATGATRHFLQAIEMGSQLSQRIPVAEVLSDVDPGDLEVDLGKLRY